MMESAPIPGQPGSPVLARLNLMMMGIALALAGGRILCSAIAAYPIDRDQLVADALLPTIIFCISFIFTVIRYVPSVSLIACATAMLTLSWMGSGAISALPFYFGRGNPLMDDRLQAFDWALGFNWVAVVGWLDRWPALNSVLKVAYLSLHTQCIVLVLVLGFLRQARRLYAFVLGGELMLILTYLLAGTFPALGPYAFLQASPAMHPNEELLNADWHVARLLWMRDAQFLVGVEMPPGPKGLISFPSFHCCAALLFMWGFWSSPLRYVAIAFNSLVLVATINHGSHYLVDLLAGAVIFVLGLHLAKLVVRKFPERADRMKPQADGKPLLQDA